MDSNRHIIASGISNNELACAFSELVAERWDNWDLSPVMVYLVDAVASNALPFLADQFDVDGLQGFALAENETQQRDLIKRSIALHKYIGTPWAIREACRTIGFPVITMEEGVTAIHGGPESPDDWARFRILIDANESRQITADDQRKLQLFIECYKNERSHLTTIGWHQSLEDEPMFRLLIAERDTMELITLSVQSNPIILSRTGIARTAKVTASVPWVIDQTTYDWDDGSGDTVTLDYISGTDDSVIKIASDPNTIGRREMDIEIKAVGGRVLGTLTIIQLLNFNAYGRAYKGDYNTSNQISNWNAYAKAYSEDYDTFNKTTTK